MQGRTVEAQAVRAAWFNPHSEMQQADAATAGIVLLLKGTDCQQELTPMS